MKLSISYKKRLKMIGLAAVLLFVLCYHFAIRQSVLEYLQYKKQARISITQQKPEYYWQKLKGREMQIKKSFNRFLLDTLNPSKNLLGVVSSYCEEFHVHLREYKPLGQASFGNITILTRTIVIEGKFVDCLKLIYELETKKETGRVSSVLFQRYSDQNDKRLRLSCTLYIQNCILQ